MIKTQIQVPERLYREIKRLAELKGWSLAETFRRAAEQFLARHPDPRPRNEPWRPPTSDEVGWRGLTHDEVRDRALDDMEARLPEDGER
jgi:hypothetical protein